MLGNVGILLFLSLAIKLLKIDKIKTYSIRLIFNSFFANSALERPKKMLNIINRNFENQSTGSFSCDIVSLIATQSVNDIEAR